jgi:hypothetical protein
MPKNKGGAHPSDRASQATPEARKRSSPFGDHPLRGKPEHNAPLSREEKFAAFLIYVRALDAAHLSPGYGRINHDDALALCAAALRARVQGHSS